MFYPLLYYAHEVLSQAKVPLTPQEIWEEGKKLGLPDRLGSTGKAIASALGPVLSFDTENNKDTKFYRATTESERYGLLSTTMVGSLDKFIDLNRPGKPLTPQEIREVGKKSGLWDRLDIIRKMRSRPREYKEYYKFSSSQFFAPLEYAEEVLSKFSWPLTPQEIWEEGKKLDVSSELGLTVEVSASTLGRALFEDTENNKGSKFYRATTKPERYGLLSTEAGTAALNFSVHSFEVLSYADKPFMYQKIWKVGKKSGFWGCQTQPENCLADH